MTAEPVEDGARRDGRAAGAKRQRNDPRKERTPQRLIAAARVVFERDGFHHARLADVTQEANVSVGTLYNYYRSKEELFREVMRQVTADLTDRTDEDAMAAGGEDLSDPIAGIYASNRAYVRGYRRNARLMTLLLQVADADEEVRTQGRQMARHFEERIAGAISRWQREGLVYADLDPRYTANALAYMVDRFLYEWTVSDLDYDEDQVVETVSKLWVRALGMEQGPYREPARRRRAAAAVETPAPKRPARRRTT